MKINSVELTEEEFLLEYGPLGTRAPISYLFEDVIVAQARFSLARRRTLTMMPGKGPRALKSAHAERDREHHRDALRAVHVRFNEAGGEAALDASGRANRRLAQRVARERLKTDAQYFASGCACFACPTHSLKGKQEAP